MGKRKQRAEWVAISVDAAEKIAKIDKEIAELDCMSPPERIAIGLHDLVCTSNHTDACSWYYEVKDGKHDWEKDTHKLWLNKGVLVSKYIDQQKIDEDKLFDIVHLATSSIYG
jgi:hypothetical protein